MRGSLWSSSSVWMKTLFPNVPPRGMFSGAASSGDFFFDDFAFRPTMATGRARGKTTLVSNRLFHNITMKIIVKTAVSNAPCNLLLPHKDNIPNKFRILKERHVRMRQPYQLPVGLKTRPTIVPRRAGANSGPELELLANSNSNSGIGIGIELAFPSLTGIGIELELPVFELELNWNCHNLNWNWSRNCVLRNRIRNCFPWN